MSGSGHRLVVGIEVHVQLATRTKAFCACPVEFGAEPNRHVCPVCLGHPGALPTLNRAVLEAAIRAGLALDCRVAPKGHTQWDRKNYFYPDLPKGYQITQYEFPVCEGGAVVLSDGTRVRIRRAHVEEDTGKSSHASDGETLVDFNRAGVPLLEIVTEPVDPATPERVEEYLRLLQEKVRLAGASDCSMEKGQMRCEPNVSLARSDGSSTAISEIKNINSFAAVREAVAAEAKRLADGPWHPAGTTLPRATFGWDDSAKRTILQRTKETAADYRYFPEPDLPVIPTEALEEFVGRAKAALAEAEATRDRAAGSTREAAGRYGLTAEQADLLLAKDMTKGRYVAAVEAASRDLPVSEVAPEIANWFLGPLAAWVNGHGGAWETLRITPEDIAAACSGLHRGKFTAQVVKANLLAGDYPGIGGDPEKYLASKGLLGGAAGEDAVRAACAEAIAANPDVVAKIRGGKPQAKAALVVQVMKKTRGTADPARVNAILDELLKG